MESYLFPAKLRPSEVLIADLPAQRRGQNAAPESNDFV